MGCEELTARRTLQEAAREYADGHFEKAAQECEKALAIMPDFDIANHNCALIYHKMFRPGLDTPGNAKIADRATELFAKYIAKNPDDGKIIDLMTRIWIDAGRYERALEYWEKELAKDPKDTEMIGKIAGIHRLAGDWKKAIEWHEKEAEAEEAPEAKADALKNIAKLTSTRLLYNRIKIKWYERLEVADIGIHAMQRSVALAPDSFESEQLLGSLYGVRGEAHQASWAQLIDNANSRFHYKRFSILKKKADAEAGSPGRKAEDQKAEDKKPGEQKPAGGQKDPGKTDDQKPVGETPQKSQSQDSSKEEASPGGGATARSGGPAAAADKPSGAKASAGKP
ncbi:MAG: hypothetical protein MJE77_00340 [Proteobacteria bacterium]|nr:hypothetical protein [Pseudomonadota bacterium]